jgi:photosystem II Psb27 protein
MLVVVIGLTGCSTPSGLSGNYRQDTLSVVSSLRTAIELPDNTPEKAKAQTDARQQINDFIALYRRDKAKSNLPSFTTMLTALNSLASHYTAYGNRPLSDKLKNRLQEEFQQVEAALQRES